MRKVTFLIAFLILSAVSSAKAEKVRVAEVIDSSFTTHVLAVSSTTPTQVDAAAIVMPLRTFVAIQNLDPTYKVYCSERSNVTTSTGFMVPENGAIVSIPLGYGAPSTSWGPQRRLTLYCISATTSATSNVIVMQGY